MMDYKDTLNLPKTDFPMKANLPNREPQFLQLWKEKYVYQKRTNQNTNRPSFILHDGPPYANGHIHFGHILNKVLKDIIVKYKNMAGFKSIYIPGLDCHGLPIEQGAIKALYGEKAFRFGEENSVAKREACRNYAVGFIKAQKQEFQRLGIFADWDQSYLTLSKDYEAQIAREFLKLYLKGYIYRGLKPVYWSCAYQTALAEAEVEYEDHQSPSIYVKFSLAPSSIEKLSQKNLGKKISFVIWTTTPWTLPANMALALGEHFIYDALKIGDEVFIVARERVSELLSVMKKAAPAGQDDREVLASWNGAELAKLNLECDHPFIKRLSKIVLSAHVTLESGTGVVHIAPGHGLEDYQVGLAYGLAILSPVDASGCFEKGSFDEARDENLKKWEGLFVRKVNPLIIEHLLKTGYLLSDPALTLKHSYPFCWRSKQPVIFRATQQWFLSLEHDDLRKKALRTITGQVRWVPTWGQDRIYGMIEQRPDWCLSRQRILGVPIIIHYCSQCAKPFLNEKAGEMICQAFEKEGADAWWKDDKPLLPPYTECSCGSKNFTKEKSILDVWFDSGVSYAQVLEKNPDLSFPADLYLEGSDQYRGWFHSSLLTSLATRNTAPYREVLTHGFVVDGQGKKYSKSAKNYVPPDQIIDQLGAELLRLWVAAEDYRNDIRVSQEIIKVLSEVYRKIRNTCRFMLGNLSDFYPAKDFVPLKSRTEIDCYALDRTARLVQKIVKAYEAYEFHAVFHGLNRFFTVDMSAFYLDILKDRLYCGAKKGDLRRSAQSSIYDILITLIPFMSPILSFTAEEVWQMIPNKVREPDSVFLVDLKTEHHTWMDDELSHRWERIAHIRDEILKVLEQARQKKEIGHSLDARVLITASGETLAFLKKYEKDWSQILITSQVELVSEIQNPHYVSKEIPALSIAVEKALGIKCERCWNYSLEVGSIETHPTICGRCHEAVL